jgi:NADH-quinone oxidoreductase subunit M
MGWILGFAAMASLGLPGLAGFWGEFPALLAAWNPSDVFSSGEVDLFRVLTVIAALGTVLAAGYLLWLYQRTAMGEPNPEFTSHGHAAHSLSAAANDDHHVDEHDEHDEIHDVSIVEWISWTPFLVAIVVFGVYPQLMFEVMDPAVTQLVERVGAGIP